MQAGYRELCYDDWMTVIRAAELTARVCAWAFLAFIAFVTLSPIEMRPVVAGLQFEHVAAFAVLGTLFTIGHPSRSLLVLALLCLTAGGLEAGQHLVPGRHGTLIDFAMKVVGASLGVMVGSAWNVLMSRYRLRQSLS